MSGQPIETDACGEEKQVTETATFVCSICVEPSQEICAYCTKDTCGNHFCVRCKRCSDCCECEVPLVEEHPQLAVAEPEPEPVVPTAADPVPQETVATVEPEHKPEPAAAEPAAAAEEDSMKPAPPSSSD